jgi:hypothetical protein
MLRGTSQRADGLITPRMLLLELMQSTGAVEVDHWCAIRECEPADY